MANSNFAGGNGTASNPYLIEDAFDLDAMRNNLSAHYKLISDIDLDISSFNEGEGWEPIGKSSSRFTGTFNGNGHIIKNLFINRPNTDYQGLFGYTTGAEIKNVGLEDLDVTGGTHTGGLVGYVTSSTIENSYSTGEVTGDRYTGGLVGRTSTSTTIKNSYSTGKVTGGNSFTGGLVGIINSSTIENSYSTGKVTGSGNYTGGLVGYADLSTISNSFWDKDASGQNSSAGGTGLTTAEMQNPQTFINAGWDNQELNDEGNPLWVFEDNHYPKLDLNTQKILFLSEDNNNPKKIDIDNKRIVELPNQSEATFLKYGMPVLIKNLDTVFTEKQYIKGEFTTLGSGRVFKQKLDINKIIKKISVE